MTKGTTKTPKKTLLWTQLEPKRPCFTWLVLTVFVLSFMPASVCTTSGLVSEVFSINLNSDITAGFDRVNRVLFRHECTNLPHPIGGNNRSILAQGDGKEDAIALDLSLENDTIRLGDPLKVNVTFRNRDIGPVILYLVDREPVLTDTYPGTGGVIPSIIFIITRAGVGPLTDQITDPTNLTQPIQFDYDDLYLLTSHSRCTETLTINGSKLGLIGAGVGEYRIQAFYRNDSAGTLPQIPGIIPTATPAYADQGVWVGEISSESRYFTIVAPTP